MLRDEDGAAVLERLDGGFVRADLLGDIDDLLLIEGDDRTIDRKMADLVGADEGLHGLARDLTDGLARDECDTVSLLGDGLGDTHHITTHDDRQLLVRALLVDLQLDIREVDDMQRDRSCVAGDFIGQIHDLLFRTLGGVWRCMEVGCLEHGTTTGDHVAGHRAVDTAGEAEHRLAIRTERHTAGTWKHLGENVDILTDLDMQQHIRMVYIDGGVRVLRQDIVAELGVDFRGAHRELLVGTGRAALEGQLTVTVDLAEIREYLIADGAIVMCVLHLDHRADADDTEDVLKCIYGFLVVVVLRLRRHIDTSALTGDTELTLDALQLLPDVMHEGVFEDITILPLRADLRILDEKALILHKTSFCTGMKRAVDAICTVPAGQKMSTHRTARTHQDTC